MNTSVNFQLIEKVVVVQDVRNGNYMIAPKDAEYIIGWDGFIKYNEDNTKAYLWNKVRCEWKETEDFCPPENFTNVLSELNIS